MAAFGRTVGRTRAATADSAMGDWRPYVRFAPKATELLRYRELPLCATSREQSQHGSLSIRSPRRRELTRT